MSKRPARRKPTRKASTKVARKPARRPARKPARKPAPARTTRGTVMVQRTSDFVRFARKMIDDMIAGIPDERALDQAPGLPNHKLWTYGHLAVSNAWFASMIDGKPLGVPDSYNQLFGMTSKPTSDPSIYPPLMDVRQVYLDTFNRLAAAFNTLTDDQLTAPPAGDGAGFVNDKLDAAIKAAWHEGWHLGQISLLRKALGGSPLFSQP